MEHLDILSVSSFHGDASESLSVLTITSILILLSSSFFIFSRRNSEEIVEDVLDVLPTDSSIIPNPSDGEMVTVASLHIYPIKSARSISLRSSEIVGTGLLYDRQFTFATFDATATKPITTSYGTIPHDVYRVATQREYPKLALIQTSILRINGVVSIVASFLNIRKREETFTIPFDDPKGGEYTEEKVYIWKETPTALDYTSHVPSSVLSELRFLLGVPQRVKLGIFRIPPRRERPVYRNAPTEEELGRQTVVGFADSYPLHLLGTASVEKIAGLIPLDNEKQKLSPDRFRPNILISSTIPYDEDDYARVRMGASLYFRGVTKCVRCKLPNVDQGTGIRHAVEPDRTLRRYRSGVDRGAGKNACIGVMLVPEEGSIGGIVRVGDSLEVLERGEHVYLPL